MKSMILLTLLIILLSGWIAMSNHASSNAQLDQARVQNRRDEECSIYQAIIEQMYVKGGKRLIVIRDHTAIGEASQVELANELHRIVNKIPGLSQETLNDFQLINKQTYTLNITCEVNFEYKVISEAEVKVIFEQGEEWEEFYNLYPNSPGILELSRVGFNSETNQALVYIGNQASWKGGAGFYVLLNKENGAWIIKEKYTAWVS